MVTKEEMAVQNVAMTEIANLSNRPKWFHIVTYGCQMNAHDSEKLSGLLIQMGIKECDDRKDADLVIFNTCCIRDNAERRALGNVQWLNELKKKKPSLLIGVCGCMVQQEHMAAKIIKQYPFVDLAFGTHNLHCFPSILHAVLTKKKQMISIEKQEDLIAEGLPIKRLHKEHAFITIMYGCDNYCSYCVVPYVRGRERSRDMAQIVKEAEALYQDGVKEVMLLGQNVNSYGGGLSADVSFPKLLRALDDVGIPRIRFMTSHPKDLSDELIEVMATSKHICHHLHLPIQSGNNEILRLMNRGYTREDYLLKVEKLRKAIPDIGLTTDFIVGFPGETEEQFMDTCRIVEEVGYDAAFTFIYSPRQGTKAAQMQGQVSEDVASTRIQQLIHIMEESTAKAHQSMIGKDEWVLVEQVSKRDENMVSGKCGRSITVHFAGTKEDIGKLIPVTITDTGTYTLRAQRKER